MDNTYSTELIFEVLNGKAGDLFTVTQLMVRAFFVLVAGIVIWRISSAYNKQNQSVNEEDSWIRSTRTIGEMINYTTMSRLFLLVFTLCFVAASARTNFVRF